MSTARRYLCAERAASPAASAGGRTAAVHDWHGGLSGAHHWARLFTQHGHTVRLMAPKFVAPYRMSGKRGKTDAADAQAICETVQRPNMRFVPVKSQDEQARLCIHRVRQGFVEQRTATIGCAAS